MLTHGAMAIAERETHTAFIVFVAIIIIIAILSVMIVNDMHE